MMPRHILASCYACFGPAMDTRCHFLMFVKCHYHLYLLNEYERGVVDLFTVYNFTSVWDQKIH
jgi:hypothetical protein